MPVKSFKGRIEDGGTEKVNLSTNNGLTGYRIKSFDIISNVPMAAAAEAVVKIYTVSLSSATAGVDFSDDTLVGVATYSETDSLNYPLTKVIIFDNAMFNQDIFVTYKSASTTTADMNYYIELEQLKLDLTEQSVATLQSIRSSAQGTGQKG